MGPNHFSGVSSGAFILAESETKENSNPILWPVMEKGNGNIVLFIFKFTKVM